MTAEGEPSSVAGAVPMRPSPTLCAKPHPVAPLRSLVLPQRNVLARRLLRTPGLQLTFQARGALLIAFTEIASTRPGAKVLVPGFHCPSVVSPVLLAGLKPVYYHIRRDLSVDYEDLISKANADVAAILIIHFFGVAPDLKPLIPLRQKGLALVEDCSHAFVAHPVRLAGDEASDYRIFSFWKTVPSGVGGGLWRAPPRRGAITEMPLVQAPLGARLRNYKRLLEESVEFAEHRTLRFGLSLLDRLRSLAQKDPTAGADATCLPDPMRGEDYYPIDPALACSAIPRHALRIIESSDLEVIIAKRRANHATYAAAAESMGGMVSLQRDLPQQSCPWVYPVLLPDRAKFDFRLRAAGVQLHTFGIYLHSTLYDLGDKRTLADARFLASNILCLSVHQDLAVKDIEQAVQTIRIDLPHRHSHELSG